MIWPLFGFFLPIGPFDEKSQIQEFNVGNLIERLRTG